MNINPTNAVQAYQGANQNRTTQTRRNQETPPAQPNAQDAANQQRQANEPVMNDGPAASGAVQRQQQRNAQTLQQQNDQPVRVNTNEGRNNSVRIATYSAQQAQNETNRGSSDNSAITGNQTNRIDFRA